MVNLSMVLNLNPIGLVCLIYLTLSSYSSAPIKNDKEIMAIGINSIPVKCNNFETQSEKLDSILLSDFENLEVNLIPD